LICEVVSAASSVVRNARSLNDKDAFDVCSANPPVEINTSMRFYSPHQGQPASQQNQNHSIDLDAATSNVNVNVNDGATLIVRSMAGSRSTASTTTTSVIQPGSLRESAHSHRFLEGKASLCTSSNRLRGASGSTIAPVDDNCGHNYCSHVFSLESLVNEHGDDLPAMTIESDAAHELGGRLRFSVHNT
jgi:hypothetical protein